jgi:carbon-monoxide dehydrogenase large subunit
MKIGDPQIRSEDLPLVQGLASYASDTPRAVDELAMVIVRSPSAAGRILGIDIAEAQKLPGIVAVLTAADLATDGIGRLGPRAVLPGPDGGPMRAASAPLLAQEDVHFVGQPLAIILGDSLSAAREAADLVHADIDERQSVVDAAAALAPDAPRVWPHLPDNRCFVFEQGDAAAVAAAMQGAHRVVSRRFRISRVTAAALEPRAVLARHDPETGAFHLLTSSSAPHRIAQDLAPVLGVGETDVKVRVQACGGSFGMKNLGTAETALAAWAARRTGRPVRWVASRLESFLGDPQGRDQWIDARLALDAGGHFLAFDAKITANLGAMPGPSTLHPPTANLGGLAGVYRTPAIHAQVTGVFTNTMYTAPYRGAGRPEATYAIEAIIDAAAAEVGIDRAELRRRNLIGPEQMPFRTGLVFTYDSGDFPAVLERTLDLADWHGFAARRAEAATRRQLRGIGIAFPIEIAGGPQAKPNPEFAGFDLTPDGRARVRLGACDSGQGHLTSFRQVLSDRLGLDPGAIEVISGDTAQVPVGMGTFGSRTLMSAGTALWRAADEVVMRLREDAANMLEAAPADLVFENAAYVIAGTDRRVAFTEVLARHEGPVGAQTFSAPDAATFPNGCHVCEVEIDPETGVTRLCRYVVVDDVGTVVNPMIVKGQIAGGVVQGIGQALGEVIAHDPESGQLLTASFMDYALPRAELVPPIEVHSHPVPTRTNPLGVKGVGEAGTVGALSAVLSAVQDALAQAGAGPVEMPATPARIWGALQRGTGGLGK